MDSADPSPPPQESGSEVRQAVLDALADLLEWRLTADAWQEVAGVLDDLADAAASGDDDALSTATAELEVLSPHRIVPIDLAGPVPRSLRLRRNMLVHALTDAPARRTRVRSAVAAPRPQAGPAMVRQDLVVHAFAPMDGPWAEPAYHEIRALWTRAQQVLAATAALGGPGPATDLPEDCMLLPAGPLLAARQRPDRTVQMVLRREHDALVLSIGWRQEPQADPSGWEEYRRQWSAILGSDAGDVLGIVELLVGTAPVSDPPDLLSCLAEGAAEPWATDGAEAGGAMLWELPPFDDHARAQRSILALAPEARHAELSALVWSDGSPAMPPLAWYLLQAAKVRYELGVRLAAGDDLRTAVTSGREAEVAVLSSRLDDLRHTVTIARSNMDTLLPAAGGLFDDDRATADWVDQIIADDLRYLGNARERSRHTGGGTAAGVPVVGLITALPVEFDAMAALMEDPQERAVEGDDTVYTVGTIPSAQPGRPHSVVLALLGGTGNNDAAAAVAHLVRSFDTVSQIVMVGIAAGIPTPAKPDTHVRLGDIVVSTWGIVDFDHVVDRPHGTSLRQGFPRPSYPLAARAKALEAGELSGARPWEDELARLIASRPLFARPDAATDLLYASDDDAQPIAHPDPAASGHRPGQPRVHCGRIGSANRSLRNIRVRDDLAARYELRAIEMEGSGIGSSAFAAGRGWLVIRGISDYADSRLGKSWRPYASAVAAAYTRALLAKCPPIQAH